MNNFNSNEPSYKNEDWLRSTYEQTGSVYKMADIIGCSHSTVYSWMRKYQIPMTGMVGKKHSPETLLKISEASRCKPAPMVGRCHSEATKKKMSESRKGAYNANWKGGITAIVRAFRRSKEYIAWVDDVIKKASGYCDECGCEALLEAHHIVSLHQDISKALDPENGKALCHECHVEIHRRDVKCKKRL